MYEHIYHEQSDSHVHFSICVREQYMTKVSTALVLCKRLIIPLHRTSQKKRHFDAEYKNDKKIMIYASKSHDTNAGKLYLGSI